MDKPNILVAMPVGQIRDSFLPRYVRQDLEDIGSVTYNDLTRDYTPEELHSALKDVDICLTGWGCTRFTEDVLEGNEGLKLVAHTGGTVAGIVSDRLYEQGTRVISGNLHFAESVAESVVVYALMALRKIPLYSNAMQQGLWGAGDNQSEGLLDQTVGLIGFGAIPRYLVPMLRPYRTRIKAYDPYVADGVFDRFGVTRSLSIEGIIDTCKVISLHLPKLTQTYHVINRQMIQRIPDGAVLINTARGAIIDEQALAQELKKGRFSCVLDVYENEPLPQDSKLRGLPNVMLMPHMAGPTTDRRPYITQAILDNIRQCLAGKPMELEIDRQYAMRMTDESAKPQ